jgi:hypothetical protein
MFFSVLVLCSPEGEDDVCDVTLSVYPHRASLKKTGIPGRFDSHRGQAYFSSLPGVDTE